ncbi:lanthionine synthetase C family protein [Chitinophaga sp. Mgbs1]|uniref:Lanthionine synthetase C family protein n=1 Tax=Chitinophaga solisilvae TaxID=1233460 RepID=A0A3S1CZY6_9BACT|nr:lanthionine synthetase C family protein [Chitinophaga solisilvae]
MDYKKEAAAMAAKISTALNEFVVNDTNTGLLGGYTGSALFYAYYYQLTSSDEHLDKAHAIIEKSIESLGQEATNGSHCSGVAGVAWTIQHLIDMGFIEEDELVDAFADIDDIVGEFMLNSLEESQLDFLHQGTGPALYFLGRPAHIAEKYLVPMVTHLEQQAVILPTGISWRDEFARSNKPEYAGKEVFNLGLAHGVPSIIALLARLYEKGIAKERAAVLAHDSIQWLLSAKKPQAGGGESWYPTLVDAANVPSGDRHSRLGWCYGDLGIATMLMGAGERLQRNDYKTEAHQMMRDIAQHRDLKNGAVFDACLCHGSAGIAHIFQRGAASTGDPLLAQATDQWIQHTLALSNRPGPVGYQFYHMPDWVDSYNMLEGITGIGLALVSYMEPGIRPDWGNGMLIS